MAGNKQQTQLNLESFSIPLRALEERQGRIFPTTISLDIALSGGIPEGSSVLLSGKPKIGKTSLALHFVSQCHKLDPSKKVYYFDVEGRLRSELVKCFRHINEENFTVIRSNSTKI